MYEFIYLTITAAVQSVNNLVLILSTMKWLCCYREVAIYRLYTGYIPGYHTAFYRIGPLVGGVDLYSSSTSSSESLELSTPSALLLSSVLPRAR